MSTPISPPSNIAEITAPLLLGIMWNWALYGALAVQFYVYSYNFNDRKLVKVLVYSVFALETLQTALTGADANYWFVSGFGNFERLSRPFASEYDVPVMVAIIAVIVQFFFAYRIWVINKRCLWICIIICLTSLTAAGGTLVGGIRTAIQGQFFQGGALQSDALVSVVGGVVCEVLIASTMTFLLLREKAHISRTGGHILTKIVRLTIETNVLICLLTISALLMVTIFPDTNWFTCPTAILGKLYSNTLFVSLNNRISLRKEPNVRVSTFALGSFPATSNSSTRHTRDEDSPSGTLKDTILSHGRASTRPAEDGELDSGLVHGDKTSVSV
ncbi:hypothetical protein BC834DRAFT_971458 [Gloeopeniophorella convolvens]|nr:hypothetical protein BC834DRAFT_974855 [Gloeopeniophorella convolvens]KAI0263170.1 hypothetical protein BC834DRAFT_971458 [Gloeopeniophorella convolvens]